MGTRWQISLVGCKYMVRWNAGYWIDTSRVKDI